MDDYSFRSSQMMITELRTLWVDQQKNTEYKCIYSYKNV